MTNPAPLSDSVHRAGLQKLTAYLHDSEQILASWDDYSEQHSDPETFLPLDEHSYAQRQRQRDADTWSSFARLFHHADDLLAMAEHQLAQLPAAGARHHAWKVKALRTSLEKLHALQSEWREMRAMPPKDARPGTDAHDEPRAERNAEAWHYLDQWAVHGQTLIDINTLVHQQPRPHSSPGPGPAKAPTPLTSPSQPAAPRCRT